MFTCSHCNHSQYVSPLLIPALRQIIADTAQQRNEWDDSPEGLTLKAMKRIVATHNKRWWLVVASQDVSSLSLSSPVAPSPHIFPIKNKICIIPPGAPLPSLLSGHYRLTHRHHHHHRCRIPLRCCPSRRLLRRHHHRRLRCSSRCPRERAKAWGKKDTVVALHRTHPKCFTHASL